ncbi:hypothetical protein [Symbioplanes lichenis]|uniref:hypothetical protein n=1 Tax=Symbioplanes lichenis TaxID=1629072 RepID=UPI0027392053|nr:hypothetical protein [Actinoplanes lichenis]
MSQPSSVPKKVRVVVAVVLLAAAAAVLALWPDTAPKQAKSKFVSPGAGLTVAYDEKTGEINIAAIGYRKKSVAQVRVGSNPWQDVRADDNGTVKYTVMLGARPGLSGTSVLVSGRSASAGSRTLIGGLPPAASARGGVDLTPYAVANGLILMAVVAAFGHRPRRGRHRRTRVRDTATVAFA